MKLILKYTFVTILIFSTYHLFRDILQTFDMDNILTEIFHRPHVWCSPYCDIVTYPLDILGIVGSIIVLRRNYLGKMGFTVLLSLLLWPIAVFLP